MWLIAWDKYALAALAVEHQLEYGQSLLHKEVVMAIASAASASGRSDLLGVLYDELVRWVVVGCACRVCVCCRYRKKWEDLSGKLGESFDIKAASARNEVGSRHVTFSLARLLLLGNVGGSEGVV